MADLFESRQMTPMQGQVSSFLSSPGWAMARQAIQNSANAQRNQPTGMSPTQAYQQAVIAQATANQNRRINELRIKGMEQAQDPYYEFRVGKEEGYIPEQMSWAEFQQAKFRRTDMTSPGKNLAIRNTLQEAIKNETDPQKRAELEDQLTFFENAVRAPTIFAGGGGSQYGLQPLTSDVTELVSAPAATGREATLTGAKEEAKEEVGFSFKQLDRGWNQASGGQEAVRLADQMLDMTNDYIERFDRGEFDTGFIADLMFNMFGKGPEEIGELNADSVLMGLKNLGITNLAPVTVQEFVAVLNMWANISKNPEANKGSLKAAKNRLEKAARLAKQDISRGERTIKQYGSEDDYSSYRNIYYPDTSPDTSDDDPEIP